MPNHVAFASTNGRPPAAKRRSKKDKRRSKRTPRKKDDGKNRGPTRTAAASNDHVQHDTKTSHSSLRNASDEKRSFELFIPGITGRARCMNDTLVAYEESVVVGGTSNNAAQPSEDRKLSIDTPSLPPTLTTVSSSSDVSSMVVLPPEKPPESRQRKRRTDSSSPVCGIPQQSEQHKEEEEEEAAKSDSEAGQSMSSLKLFLCVTSSSSRHAEASSTIVLADQRSNQSGPEFGMANYSPASYNVHRRQGKAEALSYASGQEQTFVVGQNLCLRCYGELQSNLWSHSPLRNQQRLGGPERIDPPENAFRSSYDHRRPDPVGQLVHVRDLTYNQQQQLRPAFADPPQSICHSQPPDPPGSISITSICDDRPQRISSAPQRQTLESIRGGRPPLIPKNPTTTLKSTHGYTSQDSPKSSVTNSPSIMTLFVPNIMHPLHDSLNRSNHSRNSIRSSKSRESYSDKIICCEMSGTGSEGSSSEGEGSFNSMPSLGTLSSSLDSFTSTDFPSTAKLLAQTMPK